MNNSQSLLTFVAQFLGATLLLCVLGSGMLGSAPAYAQKDFEEWKKKQQKQYQNYLDEQDKAFLKFLKKQWKNVDVQSKMGSVIDDKPEDIPTAGKPEVSPGPTSSTVSDPAVETEEAEEEPASRETDRAEPETEEPPSDPAGEEPAREEEPEEQANPEEPPSPPNPQPEPNQQQEGAEGMSTTSLGFFGVQTSVPYTSSLAPSLDGAPGKESIRTFWKSMAKQKYAPTLDAVQKKREELGLSDWGYYVYLRDLGNRFYEQKGGASGSNAATLWTWFMMMKSGYAVRVGYRDDNIFLMLPVNTQIYNRPQLYLNDQRYYLMVEESGGGSLRTYEGQHGDADQVLSLDERVLPSLKGTTKTRTASFSYDDERYNIEFKYDTAALDYLRAYPNVELDVLFGAGVSSVAESSLKDALQPHIEDRSPREAVSFLLQFVQFATKYKRDKENFGEERYLFTEESLAANASDCEDRAVFFAYLVRTLLDRTVVGLKWPTHVATAVKAEDGLEATSEDRTLTVDGSTYIMADPTYINSTLGMEMPFVEGKEPDVITFAQN